MSDLAQRFEQNPLLRPADVRPSRDDMVVECLLNPGVFRYRGRTGLLLRVAERPAQESGWVSVPVIEPTEPSGIRILRFAQNDPDLTPVDPRVFRYKQVMYLTTLSHLRLAWSDDGVHFVADARPTLLGAGTYEAFGIEDCRVTQIGDTYYLSYTAVSLSGVCVGLISTTDWVEFKRHGLIFGPHNKDVALFDERLDGQYLALTRPSGVDIGGNFIWLARSPDLIHWGQHQCLARVRPGMWDEERVGGGAAPIRTERGWLEIYHGATRAHRYCLGGLLLDLEDPSHVLARSENPIMEPTSPYEMEGFFGHVVFTNGHVVDGDTVTVYYGAADEIVCGAKFSLDEIVKSLSHFHYS
jgi:predicted GH43/DUF377 family glycosyl hydrolase